MRAFAEAHRAVIDITDATSSRVAIAAETARGSSVEGGRPKLSMNVMYITLRRWVDARIGAV